jgi:hypothetical protein
LEAREMKNKIPKLMVIVMALALFFSLILSGCATLKSAVGGSAEVPQVERVSGEQMTKDLASSAATTAVETTAASGDYVAEEGSSDYNTAIIASGKIIKTASIQLEVKKGEFEKKFFEISAIATQNNGFVSSSQSYSDEEGKLTSGNIQIRVDQKNFESVIDKIKALGTVKNIALGGQDISQEYTDLQSRLKNFQAQEQVLLDLMKQSTNVKDSIEVEKELTNVQGEIEVIKGRMNYLDNMVSFSTIDVSLAEPQAITSAQSGGFLDAVKRGASGALTVIKGMTVVFIVISPILVLTAIILIIIWQSIRARNRKRAAAKKA